MHECKACGSQDITQHIEHENIRYREGAVDAALSYYLCNTCGREFVPADIIKRNDAAVRAAKDAHDGLLPAE